MEFVHPIKEQEKIEAIKKILAKKNQRDLLLFVFGINTGLRISDLLELKVKDVLDTNNKPKISCEIREKKTGKNKIFILNDRTREALESYYNGYEFQGEEYLFKSRTGNNRPIGREQAWRILSGAAKAAGIDVRIGTHTLRKTFGYHAYNNGIDITLLQKIFNHSSPSITLRYIGIEQEDINDVYKKLNL